MPQASRKAGGTNIDEDLTQGRKDAGDTEEEKEFLPQTNTNLTNPALMGKPFNFVELVVVVSVFDW